MSVSASGPIHVTCSMDFAKSHRLNHIASGITHRSMTSTFFADWELANNSTSVCVGNLDERIHTCPTLEVPHKRPSPTCELKSCLAQIHLQTHVNVGRGGKGGRGGTTAA